jgi:hypothetical protein
MKYSLALTLAIGLGLNVSCSHKTTSHRRANAHTYSEAQATQHRISNNRVKTPRQSEELSEKHAAERKTADSQMKSSDDDVAVTRKIRDRITDMDDLSTRAQNITIVTHEHNVTLKGTVNKQEEITKIMNVAKEYASERSISNQLRVHK